MFLFKKKKELPTECQQLLNFYNENPNIFADFSTVSERREIVKKIYDILEYTGLPKKTSEIKKSDKPGITVYRGISAKSKEELQVYGMQFTDGEVFFGGRASTCGTGIYTVIGDKDYAYKYATDGYTNDVGIVIEGVLDGNTKIITQEELYNKRDQILERLNTYPALKSYIKVLEDDGAFAAILGYQAIHVPSKKYMVILDRTQLAVNVVDMIHQLAELAVSKERR